MVNRRHILLRCQPVPHGGIKGIGVRTRGSLVDPRFFQRIDISEAIKAARGVVNALKIAEIGRSGNLYFRTGIPTPSPSVADPWPPL